MKTIITRYVLLLAAVLLAFASACSSQGDPSLKLRWETPPEFRVPESVIYDPVNEVFYVSNIDGRPTGVDSSGFISRLSTDGKILDLHWVDGLNAPKGMGIHDGKLFVTDITRVAEIDIATGSIVRFYEAEGSEFLNDITVAEDGTVYVSDSNTGRIYRLKDGRLEPWMEGDELQGANGLLAEDGRLMMVSFATGNMYRIDPETKKAELFATGLESGDGLEAAGNGDYLASSWAGKVFYVFRDGRVKTLLDTQADSVNAADIEFVPMLHLLLVPTFFDNRVRAYELTY